MLKIENKIELLAPAGNLHKLKTALAFGANAVYAGIPDFSLRVRINDFDFNSLDKATEYCHQKGKKLYATLNIFAHNKHLKAVEKHLKKLKTIGVDGLIISDPGVLAISKKVWPKADIHLSTQANCTNAQAAKFWQKQGVSRVILGRETTLAEIKEIHLVCPDLELEYFVHGAMCMAYSGRCFLSSLTSGRSANLGDCIQPCRWQYTIQSDERGSDTFNLQEDQHGSYILNSKDLCLIKYLRDLQEAGICSFKIEGRAKSAYYQAVVAGIYSRAIENMECEEKKELDYYFNELKTKIVNRGYTAGFLLGEKGEQNIVNSHEDSDWEFCGQVIKTTDRRRQTADKNYTYVKVHNTIKVGDEIEIVKPKYDIIKMVIDKLIDPETGEKLDEAHGGQGRVVLLKVNEDVPEYSVIRRRIKI
ncbi:U32 family peptidase C-terminal domain-containing protein [Candidatus Parcubacteria bacterium]|nr:U32 family peptidase C-terminal domain-containing protein [Candidatus Parcubacteria bacterium]